MFHKRPTTRGLAVLMGSSATCSLVLSLHYFITSASGHTLLLPVLFLAHLGLVGDLLL